MTSELTVVVNSARNSYKNVVLNSDEVATPKVRGGQGGHEKLFVFPVIRLREPDLAPAHG